MSPSRRFRRSPDPENRGLQERTVGRWRSGHGGPGVFHTWNIRFEALAIVNANPAMRPCATPGHFILGGYLAKDFLTMSSSLPSTLYGSRFSSRAMARQISVCVVGSRKSITSVPSV